MPIYTRTGDDGTTSLYGDVRVAKDDSRIEVCGSIDELSAALGVVRAEGLPKDWSGAVLRIQQELILFCTEIVSGKSGIAEEHIRTLESEINYLEQDLPPLKTFVFAGQNRLSAYLHSARTICRRTERHLVALSRSVSVPPVLIAYVNRLSDWLFAAARKMEDEGKVEG